jgi:micrococcal nuclease
MFRGTPTWVQVGLWVVFLPFVAALLIASDRSPSPVRHGLATVVLVAGGLVWIPTGDGGEEARLALEQAGAEAEAEAAEIADAEAADRAEAQAAAETEAQAAAEAEAAAAALAAEEAAERAAAREAAAEERRAARDAADAAAAEAAASSTWTVIDVVDGDTIDVRGADGREERVRIAGVDTPERGQCGFGPASSAMAALVLGEEVELIAGSRDDRDRYDRIIRYVDVDGVDAGLTLIEEGLAIARYDSRDGYGSHPREAQYVAADEASDDTCVPEPEPAPAPPPAPAPAPSPPSPSGSGPGSGPEGAWKNCTEARDHGAAPVYRGDPGYGGHLDRDDDGIGCE